MREHLTTIFTTNPTEPGGLVIFDLLRKLMCSAAVGLNKIKNNAEHINEQKQETGN